MARAPKRLQPKYVPFEHHGTSYVVDLANRVAVVQGRAGNKIAHHLKITKKVIKTLYPENIDLVPEYRGITTE